MAGVKYKYSRVHIGKDWQEDGDYTPYRTFYSIKTARSWMHDDIHDVLAKWPELGKPVKSEDGLTVEAGNGEFRVRWEIQEIKDNG